MHSIQRKVDAIKNNGTCAACCSREGGCSHEIKSKLWNTGLTNHRRHYNHPLFGPSP